MHWREYTMIPGQMKKTQAPASRGSFPKPPNNAEIVFSRVLQLLQQQSNVPRQDWLKKKHTIADVQEAVTKAQERYNLRSKDSKVRKWLARFSTGVLHYGRILELLFVVSSQEDPLSDPGDMYTGVGFERRWQ
jgi:hypothetical protein